MSQDPYVTPPATVGSSSSRLPSFPSFAILGPPVVTIVAWVGHLFMGPYGRFDLSLSWNQAILLTLTLAWWLALVVECIALPIGLFKLFRIQSLRTTQYISIAAIGATYFVFHLTWFFLRFVFGWHVIA